MHRTHDVAGVRAFDDGYGEREWHRLLTRPSDEVSFHVHRHSLARFVRPGARVLEICEGPGRSTTELVRLGARVTVGTSPKRNGASTPPSCGRRAASTWSRPGCPSTRLTSRASCRAALTPSSATGASSATSSTMRVVFAVHFGLGAFPQAVKDPALVRALRYALLVLVATEVIPALLRR